MRFSKLENTIGIKFKNIDFLKQAVVHRSYINEHPDFYLGHNERLEFLGDAVLEIVVTEYLYHHFPGLPEGDLTNIRASLVNSKMLHKVASKINLENYLFLSKGEAKGGNLKARQYIVANAVEALIGAIYLDQGIKMAKKFIYSFIISELDYVISNQLYLDPKSIFQEKVQEKFRITPHYKVLKESGPDHAKIFEVGLYIGDELAATGIGTSKQEAQVEAARKALKERGWFKKMPARILSASSN